LPDCIHQLQLNLRDSLWNNHQADDEKQKYKMKQKINYNNYVLFNNDTTHCPGYVLEHVGELKYAV